MAILSTYVTGALILHNEISHAPYDAIDIGWGWGTNDGGTNPAYMTRNRQYYDHPENLVYDTPTTHRDVVVAFNKVHKVKRHFGDGGAIYNLSASLGTLITENHLFDINKRIGIYLDEGSITIRANVIKDAAPWLNINADDPLHPKRIATRNRATGNWHDTDMANGSWTLYKDNIVDDDLVVNDGRWAEEAFQIMVHAGIEAGIELPSYPIRA